MIRFIAKLFTVAAVLAIFLPVQPSSAQNVAYVSATGGGSTCSQTAPCATILAAADSLIASGGRVVCVTPSTQDGFAIDGNFAFDCPSTTWTGGITLEPGVVTFEHIVFNELNNSPSFGIKVQTGGTVIFEDCDIEQFTGTALDIEPNGALNLVIKNSRISNNVSGVLIKPAAGGSVTATFDGVTIVDNSGGGLKTDTTNGLVSVDISNSTISKNSGNGMNAVGGAGGPNMFNIHNSVVAKNGAAGVQVNGATAAAMVDTTLLDSNATGATAVVNGGHILTYGNNRTVGSPGSGFTGTAPLN
jgi:hypothetical protein